MYTDDLDAAIWLGKAVPSLGPNQLTSERNSTTAAGGGGGGGGVAQFYSLPSQLKLSNGHLNLDT